MSVYIASGEQQKIIENIKSLANVAFSDPKIALHTIALQVKNNWLKGEVTVIIIPNQEDRERFLSYIRSMGMEQMLLTIQLQESISDQDLTFLRNICQQEVRKSYKGYDESEYYNQKIKRDAVQYYNQKYQSIKEDRSWRESLDQYLMMKPNYHTSILYRAINSALFEFTLDEMAQIRDTISDALMIYQREFEISETLQMHHLLHKNAQHPEHLQDVTYQLFTFREAAEILRDRFYHYHNELESNYIQNIQQSIGSVQDEIDQLSVKLQSYMANAVKTSILGFFSDEQKHNEGLAKILLKDWNKLMEKLAEWQLVDTVQVKKLPEDALDILNRCREKLQGTHEKKIAQKHDYLKSINRFNLSNNTLFDLEYDLNALIHRINETEILKQKLEVNTLSFSKQMDFITDLVYQIEIILLKIEKNNHFYKWSSFINTCSEIEQEVIKHLKLIDPGDWLHAFDTWYLYSILTKNNLHLTSSKDVNLISMGKYYDASVQHIIKAQIIESKNNVKQALDNLKKNNEQLYASLIRNKNYSVPIQWRYLLAENMDFFSSVFPIILSDDDQLEQIAHRERQHLIIFDKRDINVEILQLFSSVTTYYQKDEIAGKQDFLLLQHHLPGDKKLDEIAISERLPLVRSMTDIVMSLGKTPEVFQMRNASIISFASPYVNQIFTRNLYDFGIKKIFNGGDLGETILGALLDSESHIYFIMEDGLFDQLNTDTIYWQVINIQKMMQVGCEILNIDTSALMANQDEVIDPMVRLIKSNQQPSKSVVQKQTSLEFI
ncbi:MAG: hypothetical protein IPN86_16430 [Saprospiraceae bacterium]|nr:hypothetical protein [Saprospiraceae bacterium]